MSRRHPCHARAGAPERLSRCKKEGLVFAFPRPLATALEFSVDVLCDLTFELDVPLGGLVDEHPEVAMLCTERYMTRNFVITRPWCARPGEDGLGVPGIDCNIEVAKEESEMVIFF